MEHRLGHDCSLTREPDPAERDPVIACIHPPHLHDPVSFCGEYIGEIGLVSDHLALVYLRHTPRRLGLLRT